METDKKSKPLFRDIPRQYRYILFDDGEVFDMAREYVIMKGDEEIKDVPMEEDEKALHWSKEVNVVHAETLRRLSIKFLENRFYIVSDAFIDKYVGSQVPAEDVHKVYLIKKRIPLKKRVSSNTWDTFKGLYNMVKDRD